MENEFIDVKEVCKMLGVCRATLTNYIKKGFIRPIYYSTRNMKFNKAEISNFQNYGITQEAKN